MNQANREIDSGNYHQTLLGFPNLLGQAHRSSLPEEALRVVDPRLCRSIVLCGMGGSAIVGDVLRDLFHDNLDMAIFVCRDYDLPMHVGKQSLVLVSSYSGNTEETLSACRQARDRGCPIVCLTSGGEISRVAKEYNLPALQMPVGYQPRQTLGFSLIILYRLISQIFLGEVPDTEIKECISGTEVAAAAEVDSHQMRDLSDELAERKIVFYAAERHLSLAVRFKSQFCENAKMLAHAYALPEMNHNEIVGWEMFSNQPADLNTMFLRFRDDHPQVKKRFEIVKELLRKKGVGVYELWDEGKSMLARIMSLLYKADWLSFYVAIRRNEDPTPVRIIEELKSRMKD